MIEIVDARQTHVGPVANGLCDDIKVEYQKIGLRPRAGLRRLFDESSYCKTALLDGKPIAMWGVIGSEMATHGEIWLSLSEMGRMQRKALVRIARREVENLAVLRGMLVATMMCEDARAKRFLQMLGFRQVGDDVSQLGVPITRMVLEA